MKFTGPCIDRTKTLLNNVVTAMTGYFTGAAGLPERLGPAHAKIRRCF